MLTVTVKRTVKTPSFQKLSDRVTVFGFDKLTPAAARAAVQMVSSNYGTVWGDDGYGYHVSANSVRKVYQPVY